MKKFIVNLAVLSLLLIAITASQANEGEIKITMPNGCVYRGSINREGVPSGEGSITWPDQSKYTGEVKNGNPHGKGIYVKSDGSEYEGEYKEGKMHGWGKYTWPNGDTYEGEYVEDKRHGKGTYIWTNGNRYIGIFDNNEMTDDGEMVVSPKEKDL